MSISSGATRKAGPYAGTGSTTAFPFYFKVFTSADVLVVQANSSGVETTLTLTTDYTVALNADQDNNPGGTVTCLVAPPSGYTLTIGSQVAQTQTTVLTNSGGFYPTVINNALDKLTILVQQLAEKIGRSLVLPFSVSGVSSTIPTPAANTILGWNSTASSLKNYSMNEVATTAAFSTWNAQLFNGTGAQVNYTLSAAPGQIGNCDVSISGVTQRPNVDYTLAGTVVTFTTAPPSGTNNVLIRYGQAVPAVSDSNVNSLTVATTLTVGGAAALGGAFTLGSGISFPANSTATQARAVMGIRDQSVQVAYTSGLMSIDATSGGNFIIGTLTGNIAVVSIGVGASPVDGQRIRIRFKQDATGGRTIGTLTPVSATGSLNTAANKVSILDIAYVVSDSDGFVSRWEGQWINL